jgi:hypothetical protein
MRYLLFVAILLVPNVATAQLYGGYAAYGANVYGRYATYGHRVYSAYSRYGNRVNGFSHAIYSAEAKMQRRGRLLRVQYDRAIRYGNIGRAATIAMRAAAYGYYFE